MTAILTPEEVTDAWAGASDPECAEMNIHVFAEAIQAATVARLAERAGELPELLRALTREASSNNEFDNEHALNRARDEVLSVFAAMAARVEVLERALSTISIMETAEAMRLRARAALFPAKKD